MIVTDTAILGIMTEFQIPKAGIRESGPFYILDPERLPEKLRTEHYLWGTWYKALKHVALINQAYQIFGGSLIGSTSRVNCHHALLTRADVQGLPKWKRPYVINHSYNVIMIDQVFHEEVTKDKSFEFLSMLYGKDNILEWYNNVPLKTLPRLFS